MPDVGDWPDTMSILAADLDLLTLDEDNQQDSQTVTTPAYGTHEHSPGCAPTVKRSSSDFHLGSQPLTRLFDLVPPDLIPPQIPPQVSAQFSLLSEPPISSTPSSFISSHHKSSSSTSTIRPSANQHLQLASGHNPRAFEFVPQAYPPLRSQFNQHPLETIPQVYHNPVDSTDKFQLSKYLPVVPPSSRLFEPH